MDGESDARHSVRGFALNDRGTELQGLAPVVRERPYGSRIVSTPSGRRFELSFGEHPLMELDEDDQPVLAIGKFGTGPEDLNAPTWVLEGPQGELYVVDRGNARIQVYDADGRHVRSFGGWGDGAGELKGPASATWTRDGRLAVADAHNHRVVIFEPDGSSSMSFGALGSEDGDFNLPREIACDGEGRLVVLDRGNQRLQYFDAGGQFLTSVEVEELGMPRSLVPAPEGEVLLADPGRGVVVSVRFDGAMTFQLMAFAGQRRAAIPHDLELAKGRLYVYATAEQGQPDER